MPHYMQGTHVGSNHPHCSKRTGRHIVTMGGVAILTAAWLAPQLVSVSSPHTSIVASVYRGSAFGRASGNVHIVGLYIPHRRSVHYTADVWLALHQYLALCPAADAVMLCGDWNARVGGDHPTLWQPETDEHISITRVSDDAVVNEHGHSALGLLAAARLVLLNGLRAVNGAVGGGEGDLAPLLFPPAAFSPQHTFSPTREGRRCASLIDLVAVSRSQRVGSGTSWTALTTALCSSRGLSRVPMLRIRLAPPLMHPPPRLLHLADCLS